MCTWLALETISHFLTNVSEVFTCIMDMNKIFNNVKHLVLFRKLMLTLNPPIFTRLLLVMYQLQSTDVRWNYCRSRRLILSNGVKLWCQQYFTVFIAMVSSLCSEVGEVDAGCSIITLGLLSTPMIIGFWPLVMLLFRI